MQVADAGDYSVTTDGDVDGFIDPQLTFGVGSPAPAWPAGVFAILFVVALGLVLVAAHAKSQGSGSPTSPRSGPAPAGPGAPPYGSPTPATGATPSTNTNTPEQELARLAQLQQLTDLHRSGTLSDAEYEAARGRLG
jgi:hypothetical protein